MVFVESIVLVGLCNLELVMYSRGEWFCNVCLNVLRFGLLGVYGMFIVCIWCVLSSVW